jgi:spore germination protein GerM
MNPFMDKKSSLAIALCVVLAALVVAFFWSSGNERLRKSDGRPFASEPAAPSDRETKSVSLFFLREDDGLLVAEQREIAADASIVREAEAVITELIKGSRGELVSPLPPETKLSQLFITKEGTAYVDFSRDLIDNHPSGAAAEISTVYAVVNSLAYNFKSIKKVFILIDGEERETLAGHLSLDRPFSPNYSLIAKR